MEECVIQKACNWIIQWFDKLKTLFRASLSLLGIMVLLLISSWNFICSFILIVDLVYKFWKMFSKSSRYVIEKPKKKIFKKTFS